MKIDQTLINQALNLSPQEKFLFIETLVRSLDKPDPELDRIWAEEAEARLQAYREGRTTGIRAEAVLGGSL